MGVIKQTVVAFFGKPNVGKSTIFNSLQKNVNSIITSKPQTTRNYICARYDINENKQAILIDTPGFHKPNNKLDLFLNSEVKYILNKANIGCFIFDPTRIIDEEDKTLLNHMKNFSIEKKVLIINKIDLVNNAKIDDYIKEIENIMSFDEIIKISALNIINMNELVELIDSECLHEDIDNDIFKEPTDEFITSEIIRHSCLNNLQKEIPYGVNIIINDFKYNNENKKLDINADIIIEKESQKAIVVGSKGNMIKKIGTEARMELLKIYDCTIMLKLFVKVKLGWRDDDNLVRIMGYKK